jgi:uncharacterized DUF497 family protein
MATGVLKDARLMNGYALDANIVSFYIKGRETKDAANSIDEDRYNVTGLINGKLVIIVTNTHFDQFNMIRIISARETEPHERRKYDDNVKELIGV